MLWQRWLLAGISISMHALYTTLTSMNELPTSAEPEVHRRIGNEHVARGTLSKLNRAAVETETDEGKGRMVRGRVSRRCEMNSVEEK